MKTCKTLLTGTLIGLGLVVSSQANALTVYLDINNVYGDVINAVKVDIENGTGDRSEDIKFTVDPDANLFTRPDTNKAIGISSFGFNTGDGSFFGNIDFYGTASGWNTLSNTNQDGWGTFDVVVKSNGGNTWQDPLVFWVTDVTGDTPESYYNPTLDNGGIERYFAAHVNNIDTGVWRIGGDGDGALCNEFDDNCALLTSAFFTTPVPVPAAIWLFASGLLGLASIARRRKV